MKETVKQLLHESLWYLLLWSGLYIYYSPNFFNNDYELFLQHKNLLAKTLSYEYISVYWMLCLTYLYIVFHKTYYIACYKIQNNYDLSMSDVGNILLVVLFNQMIITPLTILFVCNYFSLNNEDVTFIKSLLYYVGFVLINEVLFYYLHRLLHKILFNSIHFIHHQISAPICIANIYAHPIEHIFVNLMPSICGLILLNAPISLYFQWLTFVNIVSIISHSGYSLPYLPAPIYHDFHHSYPNNNFGITGILDYLHGTNNRFIEKK